MSPLAFLAPVAPVEAPPVAKIETPPAPVLPTFKAKWWYSSSALDARPVIWSLENHPEEWRRTAHYLVHIPSDHSFRMAAPYGLHDARCECSSLRGFQPFQTKAFKAAVGQWSPSNKPITPNPNDTGKYDTIAENFAAHFVH